MKLLISIFLFPAFLAILLAGGCFFFYRYGMTSSITAEYTFGGHMMKAFLYMAIGTGLPLAVFSFLAGCLLAAVSFIFKSWTRAFFSLGIAAAGMYIWLYFLNTAYPS